MRDTVLQHVPGGRAIRILDLGCGTGSLVFRLAASLPSATVVGIDVSPANIDAAKSQLADQGPAARVRFEVADYLTYRSEPFDVIVTDGVLHLVPGDSAALVRKLAADLRAGGVLVCDMPFDCAYNRAFALVRRLLRAARSPWMDRRLLQIGRLLHGRQMNDDGLRERIDYMYIPPERMMDRRLANCFARAGLQRMAERAMPSTSPSQLKHRATIWIRRES